MREAVTRFFLVRQECRKAGERAGCAREFGGVAMTHALPHRTSAASVHARSGRARQRTMVGSVLLVVLLLPTLPHYAGLASSMALGASAAALIGIGIAWQHVPRSRRGLAAFSPGAMASFVLLAVVAHSVVSALRGPVDLVRAGASIAPLLLMLIGGGALARLFDAASNSEVDRALRAAFGVLCIIGGAGILGIAPPTAFPFVKPVFPFTEPSHFALAFVPVLMYRCVTSTGWYRLLYLLGGLSAALLLENLTLVVGCILVAVISLRFYALLGSLVALAFAASQADLTYYTERLDLSGEVQNLSNLAYLQGWQLIRESWTNSDGWGLGFQQLGIQDTNVAAADLIQSIIDGPLNQLDGGFTLAKLVSEFGAFGVALVLVYFFLAARSALALRRGTDDPATTFAHCTLVAYSLDLCIRGTGYFSANVMLVVAASWLLAAHRRRSRRNVKPALRHTSVAGPAVPRLLR